MPTRRTSPRRFATRPSPVDDYADDEGPTGGRVAAGGPWLGVLILVVGFVALAALAVSFLGRGTDLTACRSSAWSAIPDSADLPDGWTLSSTDLNANGMTVSVLGPASTDGTTSQPAVYASVTCYGDAAAAAMNANRTAAKTAGASVRNRTGAADAYDVDNPATGTVTTLFRVGSLVAQVANSGSVSSSDLAVITSAVAASMGDGSAAGIGGATPSEVAGASDQPGDSFDAGPSPSSAAPELEAHLPTQIAGTALTLQSGLASDGLGGDPSSRALGAALRGLGIDLAKVQVVQAGDDTGSLDLSIFAFRLPGGDASKLETAIDESWLSSRAAGVKTTTVKLSGKTVTKIDFGDQGPIDYVYRGTDYVIVIETADPAIATEVAANLK